MRVPIGQRDVAIALSLANLCYVRVWAELFVASTREAYFMSVGNVDFLAAAINVLLLAAVFLVAVAIARGFGRPGRVAIIAGFFGLLVFEASGIGPELFPGVLALLERWKDGQHLEVIAIVAALLVPIGAAIRWPAKALAWTTGAIQMFAPFVAVTFGRALWIVLTTDPGETLAAKAPRIDAPVESADGPRVVLMVWDALGRRHSIDARPDWLELPELDRLRAESIDATQVTQAGTKTKTSIPMFLSGVPVTDSNPADVNDLMLTIGSGAEARQERWSKMPNLFRDAQAMGGVAVVSGWYHPYCRMFPELDACSTYPTRIVGSHGQNTGLVETILDQQTAILPYVNLRIRHIDVHERQKNDALTAVRQGGKGFVFLHMIDPHMPYIYDARSESMTVFNFKHDGYYDNIALMDRVLGELRREMEASGKWKDTAVIFTADHVLRHRPKRLQEPPDKRVPFVLKMPGQERGLVYDRPFNAFVTHDLVQALLKGELRTPEDAIAWLDAHADPIAAARTP